jgi:hypothetical protein
MHTGRLFADRNLEAREIHDPKSSAAKAQSRLVITHNLIPSAQGRYNDTLDRLEDELVRRSSPAIGNSQC